MMVLLIAILGNNGVVNEEFFAEALKTWSEHGLGPLDQEEPVGASDVLLNIVKDEDYLSHPHVVHHVCTVVPVVFSFL